MSQNVPKCLTFRGCGILQNIAAIPQANNADRPAGSRATLSPVRHRAPAMNPADRHRSTSTAPIRGGASLCRRLEENALPTTDSTPRRGGHISASRGQSAAPPRILTPHVAHGTTRAIVLASRGASRTARADLGADFAGSARALRGRRGSLTLRAGGHRGTFDSCPPPSSTLRFCFSVPCSRVGLESRLVQRM